MDEQKETSHKYERDHLVIFGAIRDLRKDYDELAGDIREALHILNGDPDPENHAEGLITEVKELIKINTRYYAILDPDYKNKGGLIQEHRVLWDERERLERGRAPRWAFWTTIISALIAGFFALLVTWPELMKYIDKHSKLSPLDKIIQNAEHPKAKRRHLTIHRDAEGNENVTEP